MDAGPWPLRWQWRWPWPLAVAVVVAVATHAACQSWRGAKLWRLDLKMNVLVAHAKQKICARHL